MELILLVLLVAALGAVALVAGRRNKEGALSRREQEIAPVRKLASKTSLGPARICKSSTWR